MVRPRALDLFCGAGGAGWGLYLAGFDVVGVDLRPQPWHPAHHASPDMRPRDGQVLMLEAAHHFEFHQADALTYPLDGFDFIWASPPCQAHTSLRALHPGREYPDLIPATRERLAGQATPWVIENVPGSPLGSNGHQLIELCGTMFGLETPDSRAYIKRHRHFEFWRAIIPLVPPCQCGKGHQEALSVCGTGLDSGRDRWAKRVLGVYGGHSRDRSGDRSHERAARKVLTAVENKKKVICIGGGKAMSGGMAEPQGMRARRAMTVTGTVPQTNTVRNTERETFKTHEAAHAMGCPWMVMKGLSQAIPPAYSRWIGREVIEFLETEGRCKTSCRCDT